MLKTYFKIAWRNLTKNKAFSLINIAGLSVGLASCMLIVLYLYNQLSYDSYQPNIKRLYQVGGVFVTDGKQDRFPCAPAITAHNMKQDFPEIEQTARMLTFGFFGEYQTLLQYTRPDGTPISFYEPKGSAADNSFFQLFHYHFLEGSAANALSQPNTIVISAVVARMIFGKQSGLNKVIRVNSSLNGAHDCLITGVYEPGNKPSHIDANFIMSFYGGGIEERMKEDRNNMAFDNIYTTYLLLKPGTDPGKLEAKFPAFIDKYAGKDLRQSGFWRRDFLLPVKDIHLHADMMEMTPSVSVTYLYILGSVAIFILLLACINFMNLSTARSSKRSSEVGIRKVLGAVKPALVGQYLGESVLMAFIAFVFALGLVGLLLPFFERLSGQQFALAGTSYVAMFSFFLLLTLITGLLAGAYPAFYLSSFRPVEVLKGKFSSSLAAVSLRKGLVIFQFVISVILIVVTVVMSKQMRFLKSADLGFAKDGQIIIPLHSETAKSIYPAFKDALRSNRQILAVGASSSYPGIINASDDNFHKEGQSVSAGQLVHIGRVDEDFLKALQIKAVAGRLFSSAYIASDTSGHIIINEEAASKIGFNSAEDAVGKKLLSTYAGVNYSNEIVGVVKNFHYEDLHNPITPFMFFLSVKPTHSYAIVHVAGGGMETVLQSVKSVWQRLDPGEPFTYSFMDDDFQRNYATDQLVSGLVDDFTMIAIIISCLGLFGLTLFSTEQRRKEISVRKVLGAGVPGLVLLLSKGFLKLVVVAIMVASPIAWFVMNKWLQGFTDRVRIGLDVFLLPGLTVLLIAFGTISYQVIRAAVTNPMRYLKEE